MKHNGSLGRGLASLIPLKNNPISVMNGLDEKKEKISDVLVGKIQVNPMQPRQYFDQDTEMELIDSIKEHGVIQPLIVTRTGENYQLIAGERRLRAARFLGLESVPVIIRDASEQQKLEVSLIENIQRQNLNAIEEACAYKRLSDEFNLTQEQLAKRVGKNRATIANLLRLLALPSEIQKALIEKKLTVGHAKLLLSLDNPEDQLKAFKSIIRGGLNVEKTNEAVIRIQPKKRDKRIDPEIQEKEEKLRAALSTKVKIEKKGKNGKIIIEFYSEEELNSLIRKILSGKS